MTTATAAAAASPPVTSAEENLGPGGVPTPTPEPGPTPTPQPEPDSGLKPVADLLGKKPEPAAPVTPEPATPPDGAAARIQALTAEKWNERRAREAAEARAKLAEETLAELAKAGTAPQVGADGQPIKPAAAPAKTFTAKDVEAEAQRLAAQSIFNQDVDKAVFAGRAAHADYDEAINGLRSVTGPVVPAEFLAAALETGEASELIYQLGKNPGEADRVLSLPPIKQAVALEKLASEIRGKKIAAAPRVSAAPAPITPRVSGGQTAELDLETCSMEDYISKRNEAERAKAARR